MDTPKFGETSVTRDTQTVVDTRCIVKSSRLSLELLSRPKEINVEKVL